MSRIPFSPEAVNRAYRNGVAEILGYPRTSSLDERTIYYVQLVSEAEQLATGKHVVDLGPGMSAFGPVLRQMGMQVTLVDDFGGGGGVDIQRRAESLKIVRALREKLDVRVEELDFVSQPLPLEASSVDVITCFHSLEHWHHSPKPLFREIVRVLKPGGCFIVATPNAVNLRKRISVPLGRTNYGTLEEWYHEGEPHYRGHVREPVVRDLHRVT
jgi:SAM-dependent methyltransferase